MLSQQFSLSVVIPAYNAAQTIQRTLESLRGQTLQDFEVIVVDDGSTDGTVGVVEDMSGKDTRIRLVKLQENVGTFHARMAGISQSHGEYTAFIDSDDYIDGTAYASLTSAAKRTNADILIFGAYREDYVGNSQVKVSFSEERMYESNILERFARLEFGSGCMWNKLYRRCVLDEPRFAGIRKKLIVNEDYLANIAFFAKATRVLVLPDMLYHYVQTEGSQTSGAIGTRTFLSLYESFADALEIFAGSNERLLDAVVLLYKNQLQMDYCRVGSVEELVPYRARLGAAVRRISRIRPEFFWELIQQSPRGVTGLKPALRLVAAEALKKCGLR